MPLLPPRVLGPLSECSSRVRVQGQLTGSTVTVFADDDLVAKVQVMGPDEWLPLDAGVQLPPRSQVTAVQEFNGDASARSPEPVTVQARPRRLGHVAFVSHPWVGGECVLFAGAVPGAEVTISGRGGTFSAIAHDGTAEVGRKPLARGEVMEARQSACRVRGRITRSRPPAEPLPLGFSRAGVRGRLRACQTQLLVTGAVHGSTITLTRSSGETLTACFSWQEGLINLATPLAEGESIGCRMELPSGSPIDEAAPVRVGANPPEPAVQGRLCAGATSVRVTGLARGQRLSVLQDGVSLGVCEAPDQTFDVPVPPLRAGARIQLEYAFCDALSTTARDWVVGAAPDTLRRPAVAGPVVACAGSVRVTGVRPGARVSVLSRQLGAPIGEAYALTSTVDVAVAPLLIEGDSLTAVQRGCGRTSRPSEALTVRSATGIAPAQIAQPLLEGRRDVTVEGATPGARLDVYVNGLFAGTALAPAARAVVPIQAGGLPLLIDQKVFVHQRLCDAVATADTVTVEPIPPTIHFSARPTEVDPGQVATLVWRIDNADDAELDGVGVDLDGFKEVQPTRSTTYTLVASHRDVMRSASVTVRVRTPAPPPPPPPQPRMASAFAVYNCHVDRRTVHVWLRDLTAGEPWQPITTLTAQQDANGSCGPLAGTTPFRVPLADGHQYSLVAVDPDDPLCSGGNDPEGGCVRTTLGPVLGTSLAGAVDVLVS